MVSGAIERGVQRILSRASIRGVLRAASILLALLAVIIGATLFSTNRFMRTSVVDLADEQRAFDALQDMRGQLQEHHRETLSDVLARRTTPGPAARDLAQNLKREFAMVEEMLDGPQTEWHLNEVRRALRSYLSASSRYYEALPPAPTPEVLQPELRQTLSAINHLMSLIQVQATVHRAQVSRWETLADAGGLLLGLGLIGLAGLMIVWTALAVKRPLDALLRAIESFDSRTPLRVDVPAPPELEQLARSLEELSARLVRKRSNQLTFLAAVAHDLRTPLSSLRLSASRLTQGAGDTDPQQVQQTAARVERQVARMERMIGDLLDATRIEAGELELRRERFDVLTLVRDSVETFEELRARATLELPERPLELEADPLRIEQVLHNLLSNAIKYSPMGGPIRIRVTCEGPDARIDVQDQGVGIEPDKVEAVFEPFRRTGSLKDVVPGVGLGLSVCRRIVEAHGGSITVDSRLGVGSTFIVRLPLRRGDDVWMEPRLNGGS